ncbi:MULTISPECIES: hypothetical protein [unclassified Enterococcus]|uniref:hypothetical protein n=1 Tax=unclassified Enterococcus TaxID=2608891 RepID=UPI0013EDD606|nr:MULTISPECIES: hypothetical protein [unclassified Enterococcus]
MKKKSIYRSTLRIGTPIFTFASTVFFFTGTVFAQYQATDSITHPFTYYLPDLKTTDDVSVIIYDKNFQPLDEQRVPVVQETVNTQMDVRKTSNKIEIISSYDHSSDLMLTIKRVSKNNTWQISDAYLIPKTVDSLSNQFDGPKKMLNNVYTDYVSPYHQLRALHNINGDDPYSDGYTGGWHTYSETIDTPTSTCEQAEIFADGKKMEGYGSFSAKEVKLVTTNLVQGTNTKKRDGTGRPILREKITYTVTGGRIGVEVEATALEDLTLKDYYFLQAATNSYNNGILVMGDPLYPEEIKNFTKDIFGSSRKDSTTSQFVLTDGTNQLSVSIDTSFGIGNYQHNQTKSVWFYRNYGKVYFNPIASSENTPFRMEKGEKFSAKGSYQFTADK